MRTLLASVAVIVALIAAAAAQEQFPPEAQATMLFMLIQYDHKCAELPPHAKTVAIALAHVVGPELANTASTVVAMSAMNMGTTAWCAAAQSFVDRVEKQN
jgi:hypothetical protein